MVGGTAEWMVDRPANIETSIWTSSEIRSLRLTSRKNRPRSYTGVMTVMAMSFLIMRAQASYPVSLREAEVSTASTRTIVESAPRDGLIWCLAGIYACLALLLGKRGGSRPWTCTVATQNNTPTLRRYWKMSTVNCGARAPVTASVAPTQERPYQPA